MHDFRLRKISPESAKQVIEDIGFDKSYLNKCVNKYNFILFKIEDLSCPQASILKQTALSFGADCALHREVITCKVEKTDVLLGGSISQIKKIAEKLNFQPFGLSKLSNKILSFIDNSPQPLKIRNTIFEWNKKTYIMGILNVTPDSFSDGGNYFSIKNAVGHFEQMVKDGADIIDIGGESTRPFSEAVTVEEEIQRIIPVIKEIRKIDTTTPISADTRNSKTALAAIEAGADIINDISGFDWDNNMPKVIAERNVPVIIMHSLDNPSTMQQNPNYDKNIVDSIVEKLRAKIDIALHSGIIPEKIIIDPGIGFGKTIENNLEIIKRIEEFASLGYPALMGVSRKSFISKILESKPEETEEANLSIASYLASKGTNILRVHDVAKHVRGLKVLDMVVKDK